MKKALCILIGIVAAVGVMAAPAPYPLTINSRSQTAPQITAYRSSQSIYALTFVDGSTASDLTGHTVWMAWSTNATASTVSTAVCAIVSATGGTATATFSAAAMNYAAGRYIYEVGVTTGGNTRVYRQGVLVIVGSPYATGGSSVPWTTNWPWSLISGTPTTLEGYGITDGLGSTDADYLAAVTNITLSQSTANSISRTGRIVSLTLNTNYTSAASAGDITSVSVSGGLLSGGGTSNDVTIGLTTQAVEAAAAPAWSGYAATSTVYGANGAWEISSGVQGANTKLEMMKGAGGGSGGNWIGLTAGAAAFTLHDNQIDGAQYNFTNPAILIYHGTNKISDNGMLFSGGNPVVAFTNGTTMGDGVHSSGSNGVYFVRGTNTAWVLFPF